MGLRPDRRRSVMARSYRDGAGEQKFPATLTRSRPSASLEPVPKRILVVDNYDSFTYNLVQYLETLGGSCDVRLNDRTTVAEIAGELPDGILISPGPGTPDDAGITLELLRTLAGQRPIFGVCLGQQSMAQAWGGNVVRAPRLMHGKTSPIEHDGRGVFAELPSPFEATRYHSLIVEESSLPDCFEISARTAEREIMGIRHKELALEGVQFHPESILTEHGMKLVDNWLRSL
jgi:para-aminobenzoate synthetase component 2